MEKIQRHKDLYYTLCEQCGKKVPVNRFLCEECEIDKFLLSIKDGSTKEKIYDRDMELAF